MIRISLRIKILIAMIISNGLTMWAIQDRLLVGAQREATRQASAQTAQVHAISLYPAVISAIADGNVTPFLQWSAQVATRRDVGITVTDARGRVIARGHAPQRAGDDLAPSLGGLRLALAGKAASSAEAGDELGPPQLLPGAAQQGNGRSNDDRGPLAQ